VNRFQRDVRRITWFFRLRAALPYIGALGALSVGYSIRHAGHTVLAVATILAQVLIGATVWILFARTGEDVEP
jgi:hypothetical protein